VPIATARPLGRTKRVPLWDSREAFFSDAGIFLLGAAGIYSINIVGALPGDEVLLFPVLPVLLLSRGGRAFARQYLWFYVLMAGWLLGTIIADTYVGSPAVSRMKGIARVLFFAFDFMALAILLNNKTRRMVVFALSIVAVMLYYVWSFRGLFLLQWKFGGASATIMLSLLAASYFYERRKHRIWIGISLVLAGLNLVYAFRSQMAIVLISTALILPIFSEHETLQPDRSRRARNTFKLITLLALAGGAAYLASQAIKIASERGLFEEELAQKFQTQSEGKLGVLFGGRPETLVAIQAIRDSPLIGHGSFAVDPRYLELRQDIQYEYGYTDTDTTEDTGDPSIPTHSHLTMAWVESGIFGGLLWIYVLVLAIRAILRIPLLRPNLAPLYCYLLVNFVWDILYSPFGSINRLWGAYLILVSFGLLKAPVIEELPAAMRRWRPAYPRRTLARRYLVS
jgi:O-antigen ligase